MAAHVIFNLTNSWSTSIPPVCLVNMVTGTLLLVADMLTQLALGNTHAHVKWVVNEQ